MLSFEIVMTRIMKSGPKERKNMVIPLKWVNVNYMKNGKTAYFCGPLIAVPFPLYVKLFWWLTSAERELSGRTLSGLYF